ncbi:MAG: hypothetical protein ACR2N4_12020 [Jatrophihabitans sp.]
MDNRHAVAADRLSITGTGQPTAPGSIARLLGLAEWQARRCCARLGHLPVRTPTGTDCQRCGGHWNHL